MARISIRMPDSEVEDLEEIIEDGNYLNRSDAIREAIRGLLREHGVRRREAPNGGQERHEVYAAEAEAETDGGVEVEN